MRSAVKTVLDRCTMTRIARYVHVKRWTIKACMAIRCSLWIAVNGKFQYVAIHCSGLTLQRRTNSWPPVWNHLLATVYTRYTYVVSTILIKCIAIKIAILGKKNYAILIAIVDLGWMEVCLPRTKLGCISRCFHVWGPSLKKESVQTFAKLTVIWNKQTRGASREKLTKMSRLAYLRYTSTKFSLYAVPYIKVLQWNYRKTIEYYSNYSNSIVLL